MTFEKPIEELKGSVKRHVKLPDLVIGQIYEFIIPELADGNLWTVTNWNERKSLLVLDPRGIVLVLGTYRSCWVKVIYKDSIGWMFDPELFKVKAEAEDDGTQ